MLDSGIPDVNEESIKKMAERFRMEESDSEAEKHFLNILDESLNSFSGKLNDYFHKVVSKIRN